MTTDFPALFRALAGTDFILIGGLAAVVTAGGRLPDPAHAQQASPLAGVWTLTRSLSELPRGTRVEVTANLQEPDMLSAAFTATPGTAPAPVRAGSMHLTLNVVPVRTKPAAP